MGAVSGDVNSGSMKCATLADLTARPVAGLESGDLAWVQDRIGQADGPFYYYQSDSVQALAAGVVATSSGVGRWLSLELFPLGGAI
jgi:hypothetical protein